MAQLFAAIGLLFHIPIMVASACSTILVDQVSINIYIYIYIQIPKYIYLLPLQTQAYKLYIDVVVC